MRYTWKWKRITLTLSLNSSTLEATECEGTEEVEFLLANGVDGFWSFCSGEEDVDVEFHGSKPVMFQLQRLVCSAIAAAAAAKPSQISTPSPSKSTEECSGAIMINVI